MELTVSSQRETHSTDKKFASTWQKEIVSKFGKDGSKLVSMSNEDFLIFVSEKQSEMSKALQPRSTSKMKLSEFSRSLADFEQSDQISGEVPLHFYSHV